MTKTLGFEICRRRSFLTGNPKDTALHFVSGTRQGAMSSANDAFGKVERRKAKIKTDIRKGLTALCYSQRNNFRRYD